MDIELYEELTGATVDAEDTASTKAQIRRTKVALETLLGYPLTKSKAGINHYEEKGKAKVECPFRGLISDINTMELDPADEVQGSYRLYPYHSSDTFLEVDPFVKLYKVKLVFLKSGDDPNGITHKTFSDGKISIRKRNGLAKYIERCAECLCTCACDDCVQLAVEADWLSEECLPEDLQYLWADMVEYYSDPKLGVIEETLATHRYKLEKGSPPEEMDVNIAILKKYAGPNGSVNKTITV